MIRNISRPSDNGFLCFHAILGFAYPILENTQDRGPEWQTPRPFLFHDGTSQQFHGCSHGTAMSCKRNQADENDSPFHPLTLTLTFLLSLPSLSLSQSASQRMSQFVNQSVSHRGPGMRSLVVRALKLKLKGPLTGVGLSVFQASGPRSMVCWN